MRHAYSRGVRDCVCVVMDASRDSSCEAVQLALHPAYGLSGTYTFNSGWGAATSGKRLLMFNVAHNLSKIKSKSQAGLPRHIASQQSALRMEYTHCCFKKKRRDDFSGDEQGGVGNETRDGIDFTHSSSPNAVMNASRFISLDRPRRGF